MFAGHGNESQLQDPKVDPALGILFKLNQLSYGEKLS